MKYYFHILLVLVLSIALQPGLNAAPWEVLSDISYLNKGGVNAIRIDFALPVHYVSHFPVKHGTSVTINLEFSKSTSIRSDKDGAGKGTMVQQDDIVDISELPLLQTLQAPESLLIPLKQVTYFREGDEPKLLVEFAEDVNFSVSQVMGITSLVIFLPTARKPDIIDHDVIPIEKEISATDESSLGPVDEEAKRFLDDGLAALKQGDNKKAIQIFTKLLSMPKHAYLQSSLEFLGLARDRNNQAAQAKAIYTQYLKQYPKGDGATRVRQRLADLISSRAKPKKRLKKTETSERENKPRKYTIYGSLAQYLDYSARETTSQARETSAAIIVNQLALTMRTNVDGFDVRNYFYANYDYDTVDGDTDALEIGSLYSKIRNSKLGFNATIGRQSVSTAGVLDKFDGVLLGYQLSEKVHANFVYGYPVDYLDKGKFQSTKPFFGGSLEFNDIWKGWDLSPYWFRHMLDDVLDRSAVGTEVRYVGDLVNAYGLIDYDIYFGTLNLIRANGQYKYKKDTEFTFALNHQKAPSLELGNALRGFSDDASIDTLKNDFGLDESAIKERAEDLTGRSSSLSVGLSHIYSEQLTVTSDIAWSRYVSRIEDVVITSEADRRLDYTVWLVAREGFHLRDMSIAYVQWTDADDYTEFTYSAAYRRPVGTQWRMNLQLKIRNRKSDSGDMLVKKIPSVKLDNRVGRDLNFYLETSLELWDYSGQSNNNEDVKFYNIYGGYSWNF